MLLTQILIFFVTAYAFTACKSDEADTLAICNDVFAINYNPESAANSQCSYSTLQQSPELVASLHSDLKETSGLAIRDNLLITHNDKGNTNELFIITIGTGTIQRRVNVANTFNNDWEDLAQDDDYLYIADTGNNDGNRQNLGIHRIPWSQFNPNNNGAAVPDAFIGFYYPEQTSFTDPNHNFDCEAVIASGSFLYLFTKNRGNLQTSLYRVPAAPGHYGAELLGSFNADGLITGADISPDGQTVTLIGYNKNRFCFLWKLSEFEGDNFLSGKKSRTELGSYPLLGQMEAVVYSDQGTLYISSEGSKGVPAKLYSFNIK